MIRRFSLYEQVSADFRARTASKRKEVCLFRALIAALQSNMGSNVATKELHGRDFVTFTSGRTNGRATPTCELGDVLFISYMPGRPREARMTINQAKVWRRGPAGGAIHIPGALKFPANLEQWDLLANRPEFYWTHKKLAGTRSDLLQSACCPSIGSYGVFFQSSKGWDLAYSIAECLVPLRDNRLNGTLQYQMLCPNILYFLCYDTLSFCATLEEFLAGLIQGHIGSPIMTSMAQSQNQGFYRRWLRALLKAVQHENPQSDIPSELMQGLEVAGSDEFDDHASLYESGWNLGARAVVLLRGADPRLEMPKG